MVSQPSYFRSLAPPSPDPRRNLDYAFSRTAMLEDAMCLLLFTHVPHKTLTSETLAVPTPKVRVLTERLLEGQEVVEKGVVFTARCTLSVSNSYSALCYGLKGAL